MPEFLHALEVGVGAIGLHGGELGVVREVHAFVAEDAADFEHALEAADQQALEVQLGSDAQVVFLVERVEVRDERLRGGTALDGLQDGGFDLHVAVGFHVAAEGRQNGRTLAEGFANVFVHDEVHIALAVAGLFVREAVEFLGQRADGLREQLDIARSNGELATLRAHDDAFHVDDVAQVELAEQLPICLVHVVDAAEQLDVGGRVAQHDEDDLALAALGNHAAADLHDVLGVFAIGQIGVLGVDIGRVMGDFGMLGVRVHTVLDISHARCETAGALVVQRVDDSLLVFGSGFAHLTSFIDGVIHSNSCDSSA